MKVQYNYLFDYAAGMARHKRYFYLYMIVSLTNAIQERQKHFLNRLIRSKNNLFPDQVSFLLKIEMILATERSA
jgi:hypothetical protein